MRKLTLFGTLATLVMIFLFTLALPAIAGGSKIITLKDGSTINGRIVGIDNGRYVVASPSVGEIRLKEADVLRIAAPEETPTVPQPSPISRPPYGNSATGLSPSNPYAGQVQAVQSQIMSNPALMTDIQALLQDPDVIAALSDPAFTQALRSGDIQAAQASPQLQRLMNSPKMQAIVQKLHPQQ